MIKDSTFMLLSHASWFLIGLGLFYVLTMIKVHVLWDIQTKIYQRQLTAEKSFAGFIPDFISAILGMKSHRSVFRYYFGMMDM